MPSATNGCVQGRANIIFYILAMQFEEDEARASDEDPEFTGPVADDTDADDEFLVDDDIAVDDGDLVDDEDEEDGDLTADL